MNFRNRKHIVFCLRTKCSTFNGFTNPIEGLGRWLTQETAPYKHEDLVIVSRTHISSWVFAMNLYLQSQVGGLKKNLRIQPGEFLLIRQAASKNKVDGPGGHCLRLTSTCMYTCIHRHENSYSHICTQKKISQIVVTTEI